jgi:hypothetical protein
MRHTSHDLCLVFRRAWTCAEVVLKSGIVYQGCVPSLCVAGHDGDGAWGLWRREKKKNNKKKKNDRQTETEREREREREREIGGAGVHEQDTHVQRERKNS